MARVRTDGTEAATGDGRQWPHRLKVLAICTIVVTVVAGAVNLLWYRLDDDDWAIDDCHWSDGRLYAIGWLYNADAGSEEKASHRYVIQVAWSGGNGEFVIGRASRAFTVAAYEATRWHLRTRYAFDPSANTYDLTEGGSVDCHVWVDVVH